MVQGGLVRPVSFSSRSYVDGYAWQLSILRFRLALNPGSSVLREFAAPMLEVIKWWRAIP